MSSSISTEFSESVSLKFESESFDSGAVESPYDEDNYSTASSKTFDFDATESPFDQDDYSTASIEFDEQCDEQSSRDNELSKSEIETLEINLHSDSLANLIKLALETKTYLNHKVWRESFCQQIAEATVKAKETVKKELNNEEFCEDNLFSLFSDTKKSIEEKHLYQYMKFLFQEEIIGLNHIPLEFRADRELILMALSFSSSAIAHVSHEHKDYLEFVHIAVEKSPETIKFVSSYCQDYAQIALRLVSKNALLLQYITPEQQNMAMVLAAIKQDNRALEFAKISNFNEKMLASDLGQQFKEAVIACLESNGLWLQHVHPLLLRDEQVKSTAVKQDGRALKYVPLEYRDIATVLAAIKQNRVAIQWAKIPNFDEKILASSLGQQFRQAVITCLEIKGVWLQHVHPLLLADQQIRLAAVKQDGRALKYVPLEYRDIATVTAAIIQDNDALYFAKTLNFKEEILDSSLGKEFKQAVIACLENNPKLLPHVPLLLADQQIRLAAVQQNGEVLKYIPLEYKDIATVLAAIKQNNSALEFAKIPNFDEEMLASDLGQEFKEAVIACLKSNGLWLKHVDPLLLRHKQVRLTAIKQNGQALQYIPPEYKDIATVLVAIKQNKGAIKWVEIPNFNEEMLASDLGQEFKEAVIACLEINGGWLYYVHPLLLRDEQVRSTAIKQDGRALQYIPPKYKDIATVLAAIEQNRGAIQWAKIPNFDEKMLASSLGQQFRQAVIACLKIDGSLLGSLLERLPPLLRTDMSVKFAAVYHTKDIRNIFTSAKDEEELAITIASHHPWNLVDEKLFRYQYNNKVLLAAALNKNRQCEIEIPKEIRDQLDKRLLDILKIKNYERRKAQCVAYYCATYNLTTMSEYIDTVLRQPILIQFMPDELFNDNQIVEEILQYDGSLIRFMPAHICDDLRYALMAVSITPDACMYLNDTIKNNNMIIHLATLPANQRATQFKLYIEALGKESAHKDSYSSNPHTMFSGHCDNDSSNDTDGFIPSI